MSKTNKCIEDVSAKLEKTSKEIEEIKKIAILIDSLNFKQMTLEGRNLFIEILRKCEIYTDTAPSSYDDDR